jgi:hypothetical protein
MELQSLDVSLAQPYFWRIDAVGAANNVGRNQDQKFVIFFLLRSLRS